MNTTAALGKTTRTVGKLFFALTLLCLAVAVGFGGTALFVYHQFGDVRRSAAPAHSTVADHGLAAQPAQRTAGEKLQPRQVVALPSDQPQYTYADNNGGQPTSPAKRAHPTIVVPAPLEKSSEFSDASGPLNDPESQYIVDSRTGRVIGIDGSAGARREEEQDRLQQFSTPSRAVAVQTPPPEVRVASPVLADGQPVYHGDTVPVANPAGSQYLPVRKALPVTSAESNSAVRTFNAGEYMMNDEDRPVLRAQAVVPSDTRVVKTARVYRLPDGSQTP